MTKSNTTSERSPLLLQEPADSLHDAAYAVSPSGAVSVAVAVEKPLLESSDDETSNADVKRELRDLLELAYPVVLTTMLEFLPGFTSIILAGHLESDETKEYVDAATMSTMLTNITGYSIGFGLASALDTLCSQAFGAKRYEKLGVYFQSGLIVIGICLAPIVLINLFTEDLLLLMGQDPRVSELAQVFSRYNLLGLPFVFLYELQRKVLQAQGIMTPLVFIAVLGNIVHVLSGYFLTYHTPAGFAGIALSRSLGNFSLPFFLWIYYKLCPENLTQWWAGWDLPAATEHVGLFLRLGIPGMLMLVMEWWAYEIMSIMAGLLPNSVVAVSAHAVILNIVSMVYMIFLGVSVASNIRVGNHLGANHPNKARLVSWISIALCTALGIFLSLVVFFGRFAIPKLFVNDAVTIASSSTILVAWAPFEIFEGLNCVMQGIFRGTGMQDMAARTNGFAFYVLAVPFAYLLGFQAAWGVEGIWVGFGGGIAVSGLSLVAVFGRWNWQALADAAQSRTAE
ncbi:hypothetical protein Poli38472_007308 [Pythium oligandrum]|uniref:Multidrug and toxic compound extrusion protein n=1 Tax=Pythium oligandrum TaxID=41045 RepID=A0A8K1CA00_PYTOL|nr:hypothetical protein Poli38472_007308 [Pythium oligandrum]|eukprot:TMW59163.1 hypothetical protein Poli38472_007308 [Pythium oligandrum]